MFLFIEIIGVGLSAHYIDRGYIGTPPCYSDRFNCFGTEPGLVIFVFLLCSVIAYFFCHLVTLPSEDR